MNNVVVKFGSRSLLSVLKEGYAFIIMFTCYVLGIVGGVVFLNYSEKAFSKAESLYISYIEKRTEKEFFSIFCSAFLEWLPYILIVFICGMCIAGMAIIPVFLFFKGYSYGLLAGYLFAAFSYKGIIFILILILPCTLIGAFGMFFAAKRAVNFSITLAKYVLPQTRPDSLYMFFAHYCREFVFYILVAVVAALTEGLLCSAFISTVKLL